MNLTFDLVVVGAGSGGIGAALAAGKLGLKVLLMEKQPFVGGNAAQSGVSVWEMGVGGTGIPFDIYKRLKKIPSAVGIYRFEKHRKWQLASGEQPVHPGAELLIDPNLRYVDTLLRHGSKTGIDNEAYVRQYFHGVPFEPAAYQKVVEEMLEETGNITLLKETIFESVKHNHEEIESILLSNGVSVKSKVLIDTTDNGFLCEAAGSELQFGQEGRDKYGEPSAPDFPSRRINGVSLIYRITQSGSASVSTSVNMEPVECWWADEFPVASIVQYPNGDLNVNMLPTMEGNEFENYTSFSEAYSECLRRAYAHFEHLKRTYPPYSDYKFCWVAPALGVREGRRVITEYILTQQDLMEGLSGQTSPDIITIADHPMDTHGKSTGRAGCSELEEPYGVPYRCLIPKGYKNLLIASKAAGFSSLAASSCRLSRTMMQLGQAAGTAAWLSIQLGVSLPEVPPEKLRSGLKSQHVQLEYPLTSELKVYLRNE